MNVLTVLIICINAFATGYELRRALNKQRSKTDRQVSALWAAISVCCVILNLSMLK